eukprot:jgi/Mesen1/1018/ME000121S00096
MQIPPMLAGDSAVRLRRKKAGGNRGKNFTEGWLSATTGVELIYHQPLLAAEHEHAPGGTVRREGHEGHGRLAVLQPGSGDVRKELGEAWPGSARPYKNAVREQKLAFEISAATKERDFYLAKVDQSRAIKAMADRKRKRSEAGAVGGAEEDGVQEGGGDGGTGVAPREKQSVAGGGVPAVKAEAAGRAGEGANQLRRRFRQRQGVADPVTADEPRLARDVLAKHCGHGVAVANFLRLGGWVMRTFPLAFWVLRSSEASWGPTTNPWRVLIPRIGWLESEERLGSIEGATCWAPYKEPHAALGDT